MKITKDPHTSFDEYERDIMEAIEKNEFTPITDQKKQTKRYESYFKALQKKNKRISIRIAEHDLEEIQKKAVATGIPYQTIVAAVLHQFAKGDVNIRL